MDTRLKRRVNMNTSLVAINDNNRLVFETKLRTCMIIFSIDFIENQKNVKLLHHVILYNLFPFSKFGQSGQPYKKIQIYDEKA